MGSVQTLKRNDHVSTNFSFAALCILPHIIYILYAFLQSQLLKQNKKSHIHITFILCKFKGTLNVAGYCLYPCVFYFFAHTHMFLIVFNALLTTSITKDLTSPHGGQWPCIPSLLLLCSQRCSLPPSIPLSLKINPYCIFRNCFPQLSPLKYLVGEEWWGNTNIYWSWVRYLHTLCTHSFI